MSDSSCKRAKAWPYPRHQKFEEKLRLAASSWFKEKAYPVHPRFAYILDKWENWPKNIIVPEVAGHVQQERALREAKRQGFPLHKYIHHGLSSQAMLFNLVGPLILGNDVALLREPFQQKGISWPEGEVTASFEYEDRKIFNEDSGQPTSIDLVIWDSEGRPRLFIESKLVEREFGGCSVFQAGDCDGRNPAGDFSRCYLHHLGRRYWTLLDKYGFLAGSMGQNATCVLSTYYQFFREVILALEQGGAFILLSDDRNPTFQCEGPQGARGLMPFLLSMVPPSLHSRIAAVSIQQILASVKASGRHKWTTEFERKYGFI